MKLSDLLKFADEIAASVATLVGELDTKFSEAYSVLRGEVKSLRESMDARAEEVEPKLDSIRAAINEGMVSIRDYVDSIEQKSPVQVKSVSAEGKMLTVSLSDGSEAVLELPVVEGAPGVDGKDGVDGSNGRDGSDGKDGVDGRDGKDGVDGIGIKSVESKDGYAVFVSTAGDEYRVELPKPEVPALPTSPREPVDVKDAMIDRNGDLTLVFSDGNTRNVGRIVGRDGVDGINGLDGAEGPRGIPGENGLDGVNGIDGRDGVDGRNGVDGRDGLGFDDMSAELQEDGRTVVFSFRRGEYVKEFPMKFPVMIFRGAYKPDVVYTEGDVVAFGGSTFHANAESIGEVPGTTGNWTQQTAAGRSIRGERGIPGKDGRNGLDGKDRFVVGP